MRTDTDRGLRNAKARNARHLKFLLTKKGRKTKLEATAGMYVSLCMALKANFSGRRWQSVTVTQRVVLLSGHRARAHNNKKVAVVREEN